MKKNNYVGNTYFIENEVYTEEDWNKQNRFTLGLVVGLSIAINTAIYLGMVVSI